MTTTTTSTPRARRRWVRRLRRIGLGVVIGALILTLLLVIFLFWSTRRPFPQTEGTVRLAGLDGPVEVIRDTHGIPHIYATTTNDLFMAQGFVHAQDRFWQMDVWRHIGAGRLSEMFGADQVDTDAFLRAMDWEGLAERQYDRLSAEHRAVVDAYAAGVNAYLADRSPAELGFEYTVLEVVARNYTPEPWTPVHTLTWGKAMAWELRGNIDEEINRSLALATLGVEEVDALYPPYPAGHPTIVGYDAAAEPSAPSAPVLAAPASLQRTTDLIAGVDLVLGAAGDGVGSNSWVVSGERTASGRPLLANDPHLASQMPSIWYQVALHCQPVTDGCPFDVAGFSFAGVPGVIIGHNARVAWGFTNLGPDVMDLYVERLHPTSPNEYEVDGEWVEMDAHTETIEVAGGDPVEVTIRTTRHGPVVSDHYGPLEDFDDAAGLDLPDRYAIALRWTALDETAGLIEPVIGLNLASDWGSFRRALQTFDSPSQNVVYADVDGNIGYQAPGLVPIRRSGDGRYPVPGWTSEHEWDGYVDFDELPSLYNPPEGFIVTANNAVVDGAYPHLLTMDWNRGFRARRIVDLLANRDGLTVQDMTRIQLDTANLNAERLVPALVGVDVSSEDDLVAEAQTLLADWDQRNGADSAGAAVFEAAWHALLAATFHDDLPEDAHPGGGGRWFEAVATLLDDPDHALWDDRSTPEREGRDDILRRALVDGTEALRDRFGSDSDTWRWGALHTITFENQTLGQSGISVIESRFNRGPFPVAGGRDLVNAIGSTPTEGFVVDWIPSMRMVVDLAALDESVTVHSTGQSGHAYHDHYDDLISLWLQGEYYPMAWERETVDESAVAVLRLRPPVG